MTNEQKEYVEELAKKLSNYPHGFGSMDARNSQEVLLFKALCELVELEKKMARRESVETEDI